MWPCASSATSSGPKPPVGNRSVAASFAFCSYGPVSVGADGGVQTSGVIATGDMSRYKTPAVRTGTATRKKRFSRLMVCRAANSSIVHPLTLQPGFPIRQSAYEFPAGPLVQSSEAIHQESGVGVRASLASPLHSPVRHHRAPPAVDGRFQQHPSERPVSSSARLLFRSHGPRLPLIGDTVATLGPAMRPALHIVLDVPRAWPQVRRPAALRPE